MINNKLWIFSNYLSSINYHWSLINDQWLKIILKDQSVNMLGSGGWIKIFLKGLLVDFRFLILSLTNIFQYRPKVFIPPPETRPTYITQPIAASIDQTRSKFRDNKAMEISQFIQSKINQSKLFPLYNPTVYPKWSWFPLVFIGPVRLAGFISSWLVDTRIWIRKPFAAAVQGGCRYTTESNTGLSR